MSKQQKEVDTFNQRYPIGTPVTYWTGVRMYGEGKRSATRTEAQVLEGHTAVVWLEGVSGCIALSHVEPIVMPPKFTRVPFSSVVGIGFMDEKNFIVALVPPRATREETEKIADIIEAALKKAGL